VEVSRWDDVRNRRTDITEADREWARATTLNAVRAGRLSEVRQRRERTQVEVAEKMGVSESRVSELERGDIETTEIRILRSYAEALGAQLRVTVEFDDGDQVRLA